MDIIVAQDSVHLAGIIGKAMQDFGPACSLNHVDVSQVTDLNSTFEGVPFVGDISQWNTSNVTLMRNVFKNSPFNGDISRWNVSNVTQSLDDKPLRSRGG